MVEKWPATFVDLSTRGQEDNLVLARSLHTHRCLTESSTHKA